MIRCEEWRARKMLNFPCGATFLHLRPPALRFALKYLSVPSFIRIFLLVVMILASSRASPCFLSSLLPPPMTRLTYPKRVGNNETRRVNERSSRVTSEIRSYLSLCAIAKDSNIIGKEKTQSVHFGYTYPLRFSPPFLFLSSVNIANRSS